MVARHLAGLAAIASLSLLLVRCVVITGSGGTGDGYTMSSSSLLACGGASDCDGGDVCCLRDLGSDSGAKPMCRASCNGAGANRDSGAEDANAPFHVQLCYTTAECRGEYCALQSCTLGEGGAATMLQACGPVPFCSLL
jgi:hypothetical protein